MALLHTQTVYEKRGGKVVQETRYRAGRRIFVDGYLRYAEDDMMPEDEALKHGVITQEDLDSDTPVEGAKQMDVVPETKPTNPLIGGNYPEGRDPAGADVREKGVDHIREPLDQPDVVSGITVETNDDDTFVGEDSDSDSDSDTDSDTNTDGDLEMPNVGATREDWDTYAQQKHGIDTSQMSNKQKVIDAVYEAENKEQ